MKNALWLAEADSAELVQVISIHTPFMQARAEWGAEYEKPTRKREEEEQLLRDFVATVASVRRSCRMQNRRYDDRLCRVRFYAILVSAEGCYRASRHERGDNDCPEPGSQ